MASEAVRRSMRANRSRDTKPELAVRRILHARGLRYRVAYRPLADVRRTADLAFTRQKLAVFIDGCFWHSCPEHFWAPKTNTEYWQPKIAANARRDADTTERLTQAGWTVLRVWEHEDPVAVADKVQAAVREASM